MNSRRSGANLASHFERLAAYDDWANREIAAALQASPSAPGSKLFAHVVATELLWLDRLARQPQRHAVWPEWTLHEARTHMAGLPEEWRGALRGPRAHDLAASVPYVNTRGQSYVNTAGDIVVHALLHGGYHRGQIARVLRELGAAPPNTDFIHGAREGYLDSDEH